MQNTFSSPELNGHLTMVGTRLPPKIVDLVENLARRTHRKRSDVLRIIVLRHFQATRELTLADPREYSL